MYMRIVTFEWHVALRQTSKSEVRASERMDEGRARNETSAGRILWMDRWGNDGERFLEDDHHLLCVVAVEMRL
jgi:hypothetical protein